MDRKVFVSKCNEYDQEQIRKAYQEILIDSGLLNFVKEGMTIAIKANLGRW